MSLNEVQSSGMKKFTVNFCRLTAFTPVRQQLVGNVASYGIYFILVLAKMNKNLNQLQKCAKLEHLLFFPCSQENAMLPLKCSFAVWAIA